MLPYTRSLPAFDTLIDDARGVAFTGDKTMAFGEGFDID